MRPGYLELQQTGPETWDVLWKVPARGDLQLAIAPAWPDNCGVEGAPRRFATGGAATRAFDDPLRRRADRARAIAVSGLSATVIDVLVRLQRSDGTTQVVRLTPSAPAFVVEDAPRWTAVAATYLGLGVEHILLGIDHLLFVLAMLLLVRSWRRLVATITAFTVAHSITLALATLGFVHVPPQPVEAAIALSIVFVAAEIVHGRMGRTGTDRALAVGGRVRLRPAARAGISRARCARSACRKTRSRPPCCSSISGWSWASSPSSAWCWRSLRHFDPCNCPRRRGAGASPSYGIGAVAMYWTIERVVAFAA